MMTGRIYHAVSILLAAASLLTGCTDREVSEPETPPAPEEPKLFHLPVDRLRFAAPAAADIHYLKT